mgnify:CR=1 FL=1
MIQTPIIWNITNKCPYTCSFCCLDANSSTKDLSLEDKLKVTNKSLLNQTDYLGKSKIRIKTLIDEIVTKNYKTINEKIN